MSEKKQRGRRKNAKIKEDLQIQLQAFGYQYTGDDINEMRSLVKQIPKETQDLPDCWGRSFDPRSEACLRCELLKECGESAIQPRFDLVEPLVEPVECALCDGDLIIELFNDDGKIVDHACSTAGCGQTMSGQGA